MRTKQEILTEFGDVDGLGGQSSFFLVGIGGAGMSAVARMLKNRGFDVRGTDSSMSAVTNRLVDLGIPVMAGHSGKGLREGMVLVLSDAIDLSDSPEVRRARELGVPLYRRSQVLGWLLRDKKTVAVTGTHGKTTTTSMLAVGARAAGLDPGIVVGAEVPELGGAVIEGAGEFAVVEACEAYDSLHDFDPFIVVLTNLEPDHLDFHGDWASLRESMLKFVGRIPAEGCLIYGLEDKGAVEIAEAFGGAKIGFSARDLEEIAGREVVLTQKGVYNRANAAAALAVLRELGEVDEMVIKAVEGFRGAKRRQEVVFEGEYAGGGGDITVLDDYGHHPTEVEAALRAIQENWVEKGPRKRLVVVFQPHLYSRTEPNIAAFAEALSVADLVVLTDIYPAREAPIPGVSSFRIAELVTSECLYVPSRHLLPMEVGKVVRAGDVVVGMGAGNIEHFGRGLVQELERYEVGRVKRIAVAMGGDSSEREVSLLSGRAVLRAVRELGYEGVALDLTDSMLGFGSVDDLVGPERPDLVVLMTHGGSGENGAVQGLLECLHVPYTGSGLKASALAMGKDATKKVLSEAGLVVPKGVLLRQGDALPDWTGPLVVKPNKHGSTVGLTFVEAGGDLAKAVGRAFEYDDEVLVEELIVGVEISVPVMGDRVLPAVEVVPASGRYDFASKYAAGGTEEICPARISVEMAAVAEDYARRAHRALGCEGISRTDMFVTEERVVVIEVNTVPGMTPTSLVPKAASAVGMSFNDVVRWLIEHGLSKTS